MSAQLRRLLRALFVPTLYGLAACGCASSPGAAEHAHATAALPGKPGCFYLVNFDGSWTALNQRELLVYAPPTGAPYLVELFEPVITLKFAERLGFEDPQRTGMICNDANDYAVVPNYEPHRIPISAVHQVTREQARALMIANGLKVSPQKAGT